LAQGTWNGRSFSNPVPSGEMWECPDFFPLGNKHVLLYSTEHTTRWEVGTLDRSGLRFRSERKGILDHGSYYAPRTMSDGSNRRIIWGWVQETRDPAATRAAGWSGSVSLPRILTLGPDSALMMEVAPELAALRRNTIQIEDPRTSSELNQSLARAVIHDRAGEVICTFKAGDGECSLELQLHSRAGTVTIFTVTYSRANDAPFVAIGDKLLALSPDRDGLSTLHIWMDGSIIETFIDKRQAITTRYYDAPDDIGEIGIVWNGPCTSLKKMTISDIRPISSDRLTT
jgi:beta-fructofuranosidase